MNDFYVFEDVSFKDEVPVQYYLSSIEDTWAHWHKEIEIVFLLSGELLITIDDAKHYLKAGDIILINSNQIHSMKGNNDLTYVLHIIPEVISRIHGSDELHNFSLNTIGVSQERKSFDSIKYILAKIGIELTKRKEGYQFFLWSYVYELLGHIFRQCPYEVVKNGSKSEDLVKISSIINYIKDNYAQDLSIITIAEALDMSDLTLSNFFKEKTGLSVLFYLQIIRIDQAKTLLRSDAPIVDIAQECGFNSIPTFYRTFKKITGLSPNEYRSSKVHSDQGNNKETLIYSGISHTDDYDLLYKYLYPILRRDSIYP